MLESALQGEITDHLGYERHDVAGKNGGNSRNGKRSSTQPPTGPPPRPDGQRSPSCRAAWTALTRTTAPNC
ncbi:hypothetical protein ABZT42_34215 [Streptomyces mirabilis]